MNNAERLAVDPGMRHVVGGRAAQADKEAASTSGVGRFETETLSANSNLTVPATVLLFKSSTSDSRKKCRFMSSTGKKWW